MESENAVALQSKPWLWKPGQSGNPEGKKRGTKHFETLFKEAVKKVATGQSDSDDVLIVKKIIAQAKEGNLKASEMVIDRVDGKLSDDKENSGQTLNVVVLNFDAYRRTT